MNTDKWTTILGSINAGLGVATTIAVAGNQAGIPHTGQAAFAGGLVLSLTQALMGYLTNKPSAIK